MATDVTSRSPWQIQKSVVFALFLRELKTRFGSYKFGYVWLLLEPMAHVIVLSMIFSYARDRSLFGIDFPVFLVTGIVPFLMFKNIALRVMEGIDAHRALFSYRQIKPMDTFTARVLLDAFLAMVVYALLLLGMAWVGLGGERTGFGCSSNTGGRPGIPVSRRRSPSSRRGRLFSNPRVYGWLGLE